LIVSLKGRDLVCRGVVSWITYDDQVRTSLLGFVQRFGVTDAPVPRLPCWD
jgi:hypothetical protein